MRKQLGMARYRGSGACNEPRHAQGVVGAGPASGAQGRHFTPGAQGAGKCDAKPEPILSTYNAHIQKNAAIVAKIVAHEVEVIVEQNLLGLLEQLHVNGLLRLGNLRARRVLPAGVRACRYRHRLTTT